MSALALQATRVAAGAATGLNQGLVGRFWALLDRLPAEQQASKVNHSFAHLKHNF